MMEDKVLTDGQIKDMLKDDTTYKVLKTIGYLRDEIWLLHRQIEKLEHEARSLEIALQKKHNLNWMSLIGVVVMADSIHEEEVKRARKKVKFNYGRLDIKKRK